MLGVLALLCTIGGFVANITAVFAMRRARAFAPLALRIHIEDAAGTLVPLSAVLAAQCASLASGARVTSTKFEVRRLITGRPIDAALGVIAFCNVPEEEVWAGMSEGVAAIEREFHQHGTDADRKCLQYVLHGRTGDLAHYKWPNGFMDEGRPAGLALADFCTDASAQLAGLRPHHVAALRLYTSAAFRSINGHLREQEKSDESGQHQPVYPFPVTLSFIADGLRRLRAVAATRKDANEAIDVWRGMRNVESDTDFYAKGGTELAPMSGTTSLTVAVQYALGHAQGDTAHALMFKIVARSFIDRGADLGFLSCFPGEAEWCYPPLTYLSPTGRRERHAIGGTLFEIVEVEPRFSS